MNIVLIILVAVLILWLFFKFIMSGSKNDYNKGTSQYNRSTDHYDKGQTPKNKPSSQTKRNQVETKTNIPGLFTRFFAPTLPFNDESIAWCANFLTAQKDALINILRDTQEHYNQFDIKKRSGGFRTISAPDRDLMHLQKLFINEFYYL